MTLIVGAGLGGYHLPGDDVGVVFQFAEQNFVAAIEPGARVTLGDQVDPLGGTAGPDYLPAGAGIDKLAQRLPGGFKR